MPTIQQVQEVLYRARFEDQATAAARAATAAIDAYNDSTDKSTESTGRATKTVNQLNAQNDVATKTARQLIAATNDLNTAQSALAREQASGGEGTEQLGRTVLALIDKVTSLQGKMSSIVQAQDAMGSAAEAASAKLNSLATATTANVEAADTLRAKYDPLFAATQKYSTQLSEIQTLQERGTFTLAQSALAVQNVATAYGKAVEQSSEWVAGFNAVAEAANRAATAANNIRSAASGQSIANDFARVVTPNYATDDQDYSARQSDLEAYSAALDIARSKYDPLFAASKRYSDQLAEIDLFQRQGVLTQEQAAVAVDTVTAAYAKANEVLVASKTAFDGVSEAAARAAQAQKNAADAARGQQVANAYAGVTLPNFSTDHSDYAARQSDLEAWGRSLDDARAKYDPLFAVSKRYSDQLAEIDLFQRQGVLTQEQAAVAINNVTSAYAKANSVMVELASGFDAVAEAANRAAAQEQSVKEASQFQQAVNYNTFTAGPTDSETAARAADIEAYGKALDDTRSKYDPLFRTLQQYRSELKSVDDAEKAGAITDATATAAKNRLADAYGKGTDLSAAAQGLKQYADQATISGYAARNMGIQFVQAFSGLATGQPIMLTAIQQGHQLVDIYLASGQSFGQFTSSISKMVEAVGGFGTVIGGVAVAALVAFELAANSTITKLADIRSALRGTQENYISLADTVEEVGKRVAASSSLGTTAATKAAETIAGSRYYAGTAQDLERLTRDAGDLGRVLGGDAVLGATKLSAGLDDTSKTAEALAPKIRTLDGDTLALIKSYETAGDRSKAFDIMLQAIEATVKGQADDLSPLAKAWNDLGEIFVKTNDKGKGFSNWLANDLAQGITRLKEFLQDTIQEFQSLMNTLDKFADKANSFQDKILKGAHQMVNGNTVENGGVAAPSGQSVMTSSPTKDAFVADWLNAATTAGQQLGVSPQTLLGHWGNETNWGANLHDNNAGNIQAGTGYTGATVVRGDTHADGSAYQTQFRSYASPDEFAADFVKLLQNPRYAGALNTNADAQAYAGGLRRGGYFEDPNGVTAITRAANSLNGSDSVSINGGGMVKDQQALNDGLLKQLDATRAIKAEKYEDELDGIHLKMNLVANSAGTDSDKYRGLVEQEQKLTSEQHNNVDAQVAASRARSAALQATAGLTAGEQGLNAALAAGREIQRTTGTPFGALEQQAAIIDYLAKQSQEYARVVDGIDRNVAASARMTAAYDSGDQAVLQATAHQQALSESLKLFPEGSAEQAAAVDTLTKKYMELNQSAALVSTAQSNLTSRDNLSLIDVETRSIGMNSDARDVMIAKMKAEEEMHRKFGDILPKEAQDYIDLAGATVTAQQNLTQMQNSFTDLQNIGVNAFDQVGKAITDALVNGNKKALDFGNIFKGVLSSIMQQIVQMGVINPILNSVFGGQRSTLSSAFEAYNSQGLSTTYDPYAGAGYNSSSVASTPGFESSGFDSVSVSAPPVGANDNALGGAQSMLGGAGAIYNIGTLVTNSSSASGSAITGAVDAFSGEGVSLAGSSSLVAEGADLSAATAGSVGAATTAFSSATAAISTALPYIGAGIGVITSFAKGDYVGGVATLAGAAIGTMILPGIGTALGAVLGSTIGGLFGNKHPEHPFQTVGVNVQDGQLAVGTVASQKEDVSGALQSVKDFTTGVNDYLASVHLQISNANGRIGGVGDNVTGFQQVKSASDLFQTLSFRPDDTVDKNSNFYKAESGALADTKFMTPQELQDQLLKVAAFSDGLDTFGIRLASVGQRLLDIKIESVDKILGDVQAVSADGKLTPTQQFRTALSNDLPGQTFHTTDDFWAEVNKVNQFVNGTLPSLLNPVINTTSQLQQQIQTIVKTYTDAIAQAQKYGLATDDLSKAQGDAIAMLQAADLKNLAVSNVAIAKRGAAARGEDTSQYDLQTFDLQADQQKEALKQQYINIYGSLIPDAQEYGAAALTLDQTLSAERLALIAKMNGTIISGAQSTAQTIAQIIAQQRKDWDTNFSVLDKFNSIRARQSAVSGDQKDADLLNFDDAAIKEQMDYARQLVDTYGNAFYQSADYTSRLSELTTVQEQERLAIIKKYGDQINTAQSQAMQTAQQNVGQLVDSLKTYAQSIRVGTDSPLSAMAQYNLAKSSFTLDQQKSNMGDYAATQKLQGLAQSFLSTSRAVNGSGSGYASDYNQVLDALTAVANVPQDVLTNSAMQEATVTQTVALSAKFDELKAELVALRREYQQQARALAA